jgi:ribosome-binding ATPase YchF (GTP1/OBG family)
MTSSLLTVPFCFSSAFFPFLFSFFLSHCLTVVEPNVANVAVPDDKLAQLAEICGSKKLITSQIKFMDIAGLIKGAATGAGLGNQFLQNIRDVDVILHVVRCFDNSDIIHVDSRIDPVADIVRKRK